MWFLCLTIGFCLRATCTWNWYPCNEHQDEVNDFGNPPCIDSSNPPANEGNNSCNPGGTLVVTSKAPSKKRLSPVVAKTTWKIQRRAESW